MSRNRKLRDILAEKRDCWDHDLTRSAVRENFSKVVACGTLALGAEIYSSENERLRLLVPHTCKSRACPSCGSRATSLWQVELEAMLPDVLYAGINFTIPGELRPLFQQNRHLLSDLPAVGASAIQRWVRSKYGVSVLLIAVPQTFGGMLNFNPHLHMLVSAGGFLESESRWITRLYFNKNELMQAWRLALSSYLWLMVGARAVKSSLSFNSLKKLLWVQYKRKWVVYLSPCMSKTRFLRYAGRYIRRPPIPLSHILEITDGGVRFLAKDTRAKCMAELMWPQEMFIEALAEHVPDRYRHTMRYFGLLAPRSKRRISAALFVLLKQRKRPRRRPLGWAVSRYRDFGVDPLVGKDGIRLRWTGRLGSFG
jgi:hypothetical protein